MSPMEPTDPMKEGNPEENEMLESQEASNDEDLPFDFYVPFSVLLGEKKWDMLAPVETTQEKEFDSTQVVLPASTPCFLLI